MKAATIEMHCLPTHIAISIHAAREGGDVRTVVSPSNSRGISIHAAREGGDEIARQIVDAKWDFNPRRP